MLIIFADWVFLGFQGFFPLSSYFFILPTQFLRAYSVVIIGSLSYFRFHSDTLLLSFLSSVFGTFLGLVALSDFAGGFGKIEELQCC